MKDTNPMNDADARQALEGRRYRAVIFDWDGTLLDSTHHIVGALQGACRDLELPVPPAEEAGWVIGLSLQASLQRLVPTLEADRVDAFIARYRLHFTRLLHEMHLFEGQYQLLQELQARDVVLGVATGKSRRGLNDSMTQLQVGSFFQATRTVDEARSKPDPDMLLQLLQEWRLAPEDVLMVGDTTHDVSMAQAAGVDSLAVGYGAHRPDLLQAARPTAFAATVPQMQARLRACAWPA